MLKKRLGFFIFGLLVFIAFAHSALAVTDQLKLTKPGGTTVNLGSACTQDHECSFINVSKNYCQKAGNYVINFTTHSGSYTVGSYTVEWSSPQTFNPWSSWLNFGAKGEIYGYVCENNDISMVSGNDNVYLCGYRLQANSGKTLANLFDTLSITRGSATHDYACLEQYPSDVGNKKQIVECGGNDIGGYFSTQSSPNARVIIGAGVKIEQGLIFNTSISHLAPLGVTYSEFTYRNIDPKKGRIELIITPQWNGNDNTNHLFFEFMQNYNNYIRIGAVPNNFVCSLMFNGYLAQQSFGSFGWVAGQTHTVVMTWDVSTKRINCTVDGEMKTSVLPDSWSITASDLVIGKSTAPPNSDIQLKIFDVLAPKIQYCGANARWLTDLDSATGAEDLATKQVTCNLAVLHWTGTKCCSEAEDLPSAFNNYRGEYYSDNGGTGGCWNSTYVESGKGVDLATGGLVSDIFAVGNGIKIANIKGTFFGCGITQTVSGFTFARIDSCRSEVLTPTLNITCNIDGNWTQNGGASLRRIGWTPRADQQEQEYGCCAENECWAGNEYATNAGGQSHCVPKDYIVTVNEKGYKCRGTDFS